MKQFEKDKTMDGFRIFPNKKKGSVFAEKMKINMRIFFGRFCAKL